MTRQDIFVFGAFTLLLCMHAVPIQIVGHVVNLLIITLMRFTAYRRVFFLGYLVCFGPAMMTVTNNFFSIQIGPAPLWMGIVLLLSLIRLNKRFYSKSLVIFFVIFSLYLVYSTFNGLNINSFNLNHRILYGVMTAAIIFLLFEYKVTEKEIQTSIFLSGLAFFVSKSFLLIANVGVEQRAFSSELSVKQTLSDPVIALYFLFMIVLIAQKSERTKVSTILYVLFGFSSVYLQGSIGGSTIITLAAGIIFLSVSRLSILICGSLITLAVIQVDFGALDGMFAEKIHQISSLFYLLQDLDYRLLPKSPQVRIIELCNLFSDLNFQTFFGYGYGGMLPEGACTFDWAQLNKDDYSISELKSGRYFNLHAPAMFVLEFGIFGLFGLLYLTLKLQKRHLIVFPLGIFLCFNYGPSFKAHVIMGVFLYLVMCGRHIKRTKAERR